MITRIGAKRPPRIYIEEWMDKVPGLDRKRLADRMGVSPGTITKKLSNPGKIDALWLEGFREALGLDEISDLFRDPDKPTQDDILRGMTEAQIREMVEYAEFIRQKTGTDG